MTQRITLEMGFARKLLLACTAFAFVASPVLFGMTTTSAPGSQRANPGASTPSRPVAAASQPAAPAVSATTRAQAAPRPVSPAIPASQTRSIANEPAEQAAPADYLLRQGDELEIVVWREPELTRRIVVRPDGKVGVPLIGDVPAEGWTPERLQRSIEGELSRFLNSPKVTILVSAPRKAHVTVQGNVARPGAYALEGRLTVVRLLAHAGGLLEFAKRNQIVVFREEDGVLRRHLFDYGAFVDGTNLDQNIALREDDIVIVP